MLSRIDIERELLSGGINVYPLQLKHIKENSLNLCAGNYAWAMSSGTFYYDDSKKKFLANQPSASCRKEQITKGRTAIRIVEGRQYIILLPQSTTLIETEETLAVAGNIGGTYHSKVGLVSQGMGHIGTMLGPNFSGNSLIAIHNITDEVLTIETGESFVSVVFHYLDTPIEGKNPTVSGHVDKMSELGIELERSEREDLSADWRSGLKTVRQKMCSCPDYRSLYERKQEEKKNILRRYFNKNNVIRLLILAVMIAVMYGITWRLDVVQQTDEWRKWFRTIIGSGIFVTILAGLLKGIKKSE